MRMDGRCGTRRGPREGGRALYSLTGTPPSRAGESLGVDERRRPGAAGITLQSMRRFLLPGLVVCAAVALIALLAFGVSDQGTNTSIDSALARGTRPAVPDATVALPLLGSSSTRESVADLKGKLVVLNVFASWCDPCK